MSLTGSGQIWFNTTISSKIYQTTESFIFAIHDLLIEMKPHEQKVLAPQT